MLEKRGLSGWFIVAAMLFVISLVVGVFLYFRISSARETESEYLSAQKCNDNSTCREIVDAVILDAFTSRFSAVVPSGRTRTKTITFSNYVFEVTATEGQGIKFYASSNLPVSVSDFDYYDDVYIPFEMNKSFVEDNFPVGTKVKLEIWNGQVVFLLAKSLAEYQEPVKFGEMIIFYPDDMAQEENVEDLEIAIPTLFHPTVVYRDAEDDFYGWIIGSAFLIITLVVFGFGSRNNS